MKAWASILALSTDSAGRTHHRWRSWYKHRDATRFTCVASVNLASITTRNVMGRCNAVLVWPSSRISVTMTLVGTGDIHKPHTSAPKLYLTDSIHPYSNNDPARFRLRSATGTNYSVPRTRTRTKFGDRAFSVAGPVVLNSLTAAVRHGDSLRSFKRRLKSHFFSLCFNDWQCNALQVRFQTPFFYFYFY